MEKKMKNQRGGSSNLRTNKLKAVVDEEGSSASWLIGRIVEKGNFDVPPQPPSSFPQPTVLPFPVARHRSHGPHWAPVKTKSVVPDNEKPNEEDDDVGSDDDEDEDDKADAFMDVSSIAAFAKPVPRKQKKVSDISKWTEIVKSDPSYKSKKKGDGFAVESKKDAQQIDTERYKHSEAAVADLPSKGNVNDPKSNRQSFVKESASGEIPKADIEIIEELDRAIPKRLKMREPDTSISSSRFSNSEHQPRSATLLDEINAENTVRLQQMSPDEIQQAQSEIMEKMNPALLEALKSRGREKLKKQNTPITDSIDNSKRQNLENGNQFSDHAKASKLSQSVSPPTETSVNPQDAQEHIDKGSARTSKQATSSSWNAWSQRVEGVRHLRFSLDGVVIVNDVAQAPENGETLASSDYSADNVAERDFLRTEGDPAAAGYTIKEAVALTRSVIPGQRALALNLLASILSNAIHNIHLNRVGNTMRNANNIDWEAIWAFALGPEPDLILCLRLSLDDNHNSVVLGCAKVIQCILSCDINEDFFNLLEKTSTYEKAVHTAPVFRSKPKIEAGFLHGGLWKYNAKPSNILREAKDEKAEEEHTIQDDINVAGQDIAAGLIRMGILSRMCYILEAKPSIALEDCILSILIAIARHSPTCASLIMKYQRLVQTVVKGFTTINGTNIHSANVKSVTLLKVLAQSDKKNCLDFIENGMFQCMMWHLYRPTLSIVSWIKLGKDRCKADSSLLVEQLRLWKVCIQYGYCISYFENFFPALCLWLTPPTFENLIEKDLLLEFASVGMEAYLVLEALARRLPCIYSQRNRSNEVQDFTGSETETWTWSSVTPMIDIALKWIALKSQHDFVLFSATPLLWVVNAVFLMLSSVLDRVTTDDTISSNGGCRSVPWLPEFVPKIGLEIIKNGFLSLSDCPTGVDSFVEDLCKLRYQNEFETSLASVCCLHGLVGVVASIDGLIRAAKTGPHDTPSDQYNFSREGRVLEEGILMWSMVELRCLLASVMNSVSSEWKEVQLIETFGRGGPAPGVGFGWGASGGGFWSKSVLLAQIDARLLTRLLGIFHILPGKEPPANEEMTFNIQKIQSTLAVCLIVGPQDRVIMEKALDILLQVPTLKLLHSCIRHFCHTKKNLGQLQWEFDEEDYAMFSKSLISHFRNRWLCIKRKKESIVGSTSGLKNSTSNLETIPEELDTSSMSGQDPDCNSMIAEWAHQRLPVPMHWFLSPISNVYDSSSQKDIQKGPNEPNLVTGPIGFHEVAKGGLLFLLGIEAMSSFIPTDDYSPVNGVPLVWKLHCLSVVLLNGMTVLEDEKSRDIYEALQDIYGELLIHGERQLENLRFQSKIHESYSTFIETFVEQFSAISYGDLLYGRQVAIYLHRGVESPVRLAAWKALSNNHVLELLPPLNKCLGNAEGYLEPVEDDEDILEVFTKAWVSGALDKAAARGSVGFTLVLHHLSSFIFNCNHSSEKLTARNKLAKSLLRDFSRKQQHQAMMLDFIRYIKPCTDSQTGVTSLPSSELERRLQILADVCEGNSSLLAEVKKLKSLI